MDADLGKAGPFSLTPGDDLNNNNLLTVKDVREQYFGGKVSGRLVYRLVETGELHGFRAGAKVLIYRGAVEDYIERQSTRKAPEPKIILPAPKKSGRKRAKEFELPLMRRPAQ